MTDYFKTDAIGSSLLGTVIENINPLRLCFDRAYEPVKPTEAMENGKIFEDFVEQEYSGKPVFNEKYFHSDLAKIPVYRGDNPNIKQILEILDMDINEIRQEIGIENPGFAYIRTKNESLNKTYKTRHHCLDQIRAHDYRRPIPAPTWEKLQKMFLRFEYYPFQLADSRQSLKDWITKYVEIEFQVEYFWKHQSNAECRAKFDMIWFWKNADNIYALPFDLKVTDNWSSFQNNWKSKYIWQSKHYLEGFKQYCKDKGYIGGKHIWYIIQESSEPFITHARALDIEDQNKLTPAYDEAISQIWEWIKMDKPVKGFMEQEIVDTWGRGSNEKIL